MPTSIHTRQSSSARRQGQVTMAARTCEDQSRHALWKPAPSQIQVRPYAVHIHKHVSYVCALTCVFCMHDGNSGRDAIWGHACKDSGRKASMRAALECACPIDKNRCIHRKRLDCMHTCTRRGWTACAVDTLSVCPFVDGHGHTR
jgi:hypothetical protein